MIKTDVTSLGDELFSALKSRVVVEPLTTRFPDISLDTAYKVSQRILALREAEGETLVGHKIGLTSEAVQKYFGIGEPDFGSLTDAMRFPDGTDVPVSRLLIQPKVEGEIAFVLKDGLAGPGITPADVLEATDYVSACFEIVDSRVRDWKIKIQDTVADNASAGLFVIGAKRTDPRNLELSNCKMEVLADGEVVARGTGAAALGSPLVCVAWLANALARYGAELRPGDVVLSGSLGPVVPAVAGTEMTVSISDIGTASVRFT